ncbi:hypothetical protein AWC24_01770 [Mycolicibacter senuensis]|uniref:PPE family protein n=2 Tax=Mycolicibacter senuensis TaxID=386913 RepID=A0A7I9XLE8_9MYCO|nr:hypothetical protein AWC24_01770 [Mycolicibacter senuensis]GFG70390.1 PPE family protein [Mycolicibacter senuensis]
MVMDFGALPPEINSARMYSGAGSAPLLAAATAWSAVGNELYSAAELYQSLISQIVEVSWWGPSATMMLTAVGPYVSWMTATATEAEQAADYARAAAGAYEIAYAATVPPSEVAANRSLLALLVATNLLGQNSAAIAATEAHYAQMWAQDAVAMYGYAAASRIAAMVTPFQTPPETTAAGGEERQRDTVTRAVGSTAQQQLATDLVEAIRQGLQNLSASPSQYAVWEDIKANLPQLLKSSTSTVQIVQRLASTPTNIMNIAKGILPPASSATPVPPVPSGPMPSVTAGAGGVPAAGVGRAGTVGRLSVPPSWSGAVAETTPQALPPPAAAVPPDGNQPRGILRGMPVSSGSAARRSDGYVNRYGFRYSVLTRHPAGG